MKRLRDRAIFAVGGVLCLLAACGKIEEEPVGASASATDGAVAPADDAMPDANAVPDAVSRPDSGGSKSEDGRACVKIDPATYDTSCASDSDCISVATGEICAGYNCLCGGTAINVAGQARYAIELASVTRDPGHQCGCPYFGRVRCIESKCAFCFARGTDPNPPGCGDD